MKDSTISSARTTIAAAAAIIKRNFVKMGNRKPPWHFGLALILPTFSAWSLGPCPQWGHKPEMRTRGFQGIGCQMAQATGVKSMLPNPHLPPTGFKLAQGTGPPCMQEVEPAESSGTPYTAFQVLDVGSWPLKGCLFFMVFSHLENVLCPFRVSYLLSFQTRGDPNSFSRLPEPLRGAEYIIASSKEQ